MKRIRLSAILCLIMILSACSPSQSVTIPEWKVAYLDLMKNTLTGGVLEPRGIMKRHTIELIDFDEDGIPELQETYSRNAPDYHVIWFVQDGQARPITGNDMLGEESCDTITFEGLWQHNETGELALTDFVDYWGHQYLYRYDSTDVKGIWRLNSLVDWSTTGYPGAGTPEELDVYNDYDSSIQSYDGTETVLQNEEAQQIIEGFYASHTRIQGEPLLLETLYPWSEESARAISDFFDAYDGVPSNVADAPLPDPPFAAWKGAYYRHLKNRFDLDTSSEQTMCTIQFLDLDEDGIPELLEGYQREISGTDYYLWYVQEEKNELLPVLTDREEEQAFGRFDGLYRHETTGELLLWREDLTLSGYHSRDSFFAPTQQLDRWRYSFGFAAFSFDQENGTTFFIDETGAEHAISAEEYILRHPVYNGESPYKMVRGQEIPRTCSWEQMEKEIIQALNTYDNVYNSVEQYRAV